VKQYLVLVPPSIAFVDRDVSTTPLLDKVRRRVHFFLWVALMGSVT
jgi:hypothetical protein